MAKKIPQLNDPTIPLVGDELIEMSQSDVSVKVSVDQLDTYIASTDTHNALSGLQGGDSTSEYYHLSQAIYDALFSASPVIGLGDSAGVNLQVDYGNGHIDFNGPIQIDTAFELPNSESIISQGSIIGKSNFTEFYSTAHGISPLIKECGICVFKNKIWVVGGVYINKTTKVNTVYSSDDFGRSWTLETASAFAVARDEVYLLNFKGYMYAIGGDNGSGLTDVYRTSDGINWTKVGDIPLVSRQGTSIIFNGKMFYYGGLGGDGDNIFYSSDGENWFTAIEKLPIPLLRAKPVVYNNALWLIGGATDSPTWTTGVKKIFRSTDGFNFSEIGTDSLPTKIDGCIPLSFQGKMYIIGGQNNVLTTGVPTEKIYESTDGLTWTEVGTDVLSPIASTGSFWLGQGGVVINGRLWFGFGEYLNSDVLDPSTHFMFQNLDSFKLNGGVYVDKVLDEDTMSSNDPNALITQQSAKAYIDSNLALQDDHNELNNIQGGTSNEYYHLTQAIYDALFSASPVIGLGDSEATNLQVDYGNNLITAAIDGTTEVSINSSGLALKSGSRVNAISTDGSLAGNSDNVIPTQKATKGYTDEIAAAQGFISKPQTILNNASIVRDGYNVIAYPEYNFRSGDSNANSLPQTHRILALQSTGFIMAWSDHNASLSYFRLYNRHYQSIVSDKTFFSGKASDIAVTQLDNGDIVLAYINGETTGPVEFIRYDTQGNALGTAVTVNSNNCTWVGVTKLPGNRFIVTYDSQVTQNSLRFTIYNPDESVHKVDTSIDTITGATYSKPLVLNDGNIFIYWVPNSNAIPEFKIIDGSGNDVVVNTQISTTSVITSRRFIDGVVLPNGNVAFTYVNSVDDTLHRIIYDYRGNVVKVDTNIGSGIAAAVWSDVCITYTMDGDIFIQGSNSNDSSFYTTIVSPCGNNIVQNMTLATTWLGTPTYVSAMTLTGGYVYTGYSRGGGDFNYYQYKPQTVWIDAALKLDLGATVSEFSTDVLLTGSSDTAVPTENAVKTFVNAETSALLNSVSVSNFSDHQVKDHRSLTRLDEFYYIKSPGPMEVISTTDIVPSWPAVTASMTVGTKAIAFEDDKMFIAYKNADNATGDKIYYVTIDSSSNIILGPTSIHDSTSEIPIITVIPSMSKLMNGNVVVTYGIKPTVGAPTADWVGYFKIINPSSGVEVVSRTVFTTNRIDLVTSTVALKNGGFLIYWWQENEAKSYYNVWDANGNKLHTTNQLVTFGTRKHPYDAIELSNGNVLFLHRTGTYPIPADMSIWNVYSNELVRTGVEFSVLSRNDGFAQVALLPNNNFAIFYDDDTEASLSIYDESLNLITGPIVVETSGVVSGANGTILVLPNRDILLTYNYYNSPWYGYSIYDSEGNFKQSGEFPTEYVASQFMTGLFNNGRVMLYGFVTSGDNAYRHRVKIMRSSILEIGDDDIDVQLKGNLSLSLGTQVNEISNDSTLVSDSTTTLVTEAGIKGYVDDNTLGGQEGISLDATTVIITFGTAQADTNYYPVCTIENTTDGSPLFYNYVVTNKTTAGFTVEFDAAVDTSNYKLNWKL